MSDSLHVVIAVGPRIYREGLAEGLQRRSSVQVVAAVGSTAEAIGAVETSGADTILLDIGLAGSVGLMQYFGTHPMRPRVVALAIGDTETDICGWAALGVDGFVTTNDSLDDLTHCVVGVACGECMCSARHASMLLRRIAALSREGGGQPDQATLTPRQSQILVLLRAGLSNKHIARQLGIELATVKNHVHQVLLRLHLHSRRELSESNLCTPLIAQRLPSRSVGAVRSFAAPPNAA